MQMSFLRLGKLVIRVSLENETVCSFKFNPDRRAPMVEYGSMTPLNRALMMFVTAIARLLTEIEYPKSKLAK